MLVDVSLKKFFMESARLCTRILSSIIHKYLHVLIAFLIVYEYTQPRVLVSQCPWVADPIPSRFHVTVAPHFHITTSPRLHITTPSRLGSSKPLHFCITTYPRQCIITSLHINVTTQLHHHMSMSLRHNWLTRPCQAIDHS